MNLMKMNNIIQDETDAFIFPTENGLFYTDRCCNNCASAMKFPLTEKKDRWRCNKRSADIKTRLRYPFENLGN